MDSPIDRRLSSTHPAPHNPGPVREIDPEEARFTPAIFDTTYQAWLLWNPNHPQHLDPDLVDHNRWPRQQALESCNLLQLYHYLERYFVRYQMRYTHFEGKSTVLLFPYQILEPQPGWKLFDRTSNKQYTVKAVLKSPDMEKRPVFDGRVILVEAEGPPLFHRLEWIDPFGEQDGKAKCIRLVRSEETKSMMAPRTAVGDVADTKRPLVPFITYALVSQQPGGLDGPFSKRKQIKPRLRHTFRDPQDPRCFQRVWGWWKDTIVEFKVHAVGGTYADRLMVWLNHHFLVYTGVLKMLGVQEVLYWTTNRDVEETRLTYDLSIRTVQFYFRLEEISVETVPVIGEVNVAIQSLDDGEPTPWFTSMGTSDPFPMDTSGDPLFGSMSIGE